MKKIHVGPLVSLASAALTLVVLECACRVYHGEYGLRSYLKPDRGMLRGLRPAQFDAGLGWIPCEGFYVHDARWGAVTVLTDGVRFNGAWRKAGDSPILAVGDSFTFGDQVADHETWPAMLEGMVDRRVINAGVFGYGLDQSFLRAKKLIRRYRPSTLILSFIPDDVGRCELSMRTSAAKPYFDVSGETLTLRNTPVPRPPFQKSPEPNSLLRTLSFSFLFHKTMFGLLPHRWGE